VRVLVLSSTLGLGHLRAAQAIEAALRRADPDVRLTHLDFWSLMDPTVARAAKEGYLRAATERSDLYDRLYELDGGEWMDLFGGRGLPDPLDRIVDDVLGRWFPGRNGFPARGGNLDQTLFLNACGAFGARPPLVGGFLGRGLVLWAYALLARRLRRHIRDLGPDAVVSTQMMPAGILAAARSTGSSPPAIGVLTDYGVHDFWLEARMDRYFVATEEMAEQLRRHGVHDVLVTGIPLEEGFREPPPRDEARARLQIPLERPAVLVTGGGFGIGTAEALEAIVGSGLECGLLVAAAGLSDEADREMVRNAARSHPYGVHVFGPRVSMPELMRACDVVVGKPGGLSVSEALAAGRPFLALRHLGGQERFNVRHLERGRVGGAVNAESLVRTLTRWLSDPEELRRVQERAWALGPRASADAVARGILATARRPVGAREGVGEGVGE
jgi:processive 1,2-diacylglycerol beta-glucosyltransferase